jgi:hypothetical protein
MSECELGQVPNIKRPTGQSPSGLKLDMSAKSPKKVKLAHLQHGMRTRQKLHESRNNSALNDPVDRRVLLLGQQPVPLAAFLLADIASTSSLPDRRCMGRLRQLTF